MTSLARGRRATRILLLFLGALLAAVAGVPVWIKLAADRRWTAAEARIHELCARYPAEVPRPPTRWSSETAKEINTYFVGATREAVRQKHRAGEVTRLLYLSKPGAAADEVLDGAADFLGRIHDGARRSIASPSEFPPGWPGEWDQATLEFVRSVVVLRSRRRRELGQTTQAAVAMLDALPLVRFWSESGKPSNREYAMSALVIVHRELASLLATEPLPPEVLRQIEDETAAVERWFPSPFRDCPVRLARWSEYLLTLDPRAEEWMKGADWRWRYLLPGRLMKVEAFELNEMHCRTLVDGEGKRYLDLRRADSDMFGRIAAARNPILKDPLFAGESGWWTLQRLAELRLLRAAAHYRATGEVLRLADPFGDNLRHSSVEGRMRFWSVWTDGQDDGGREGPFGAWRLSLMDDEPCDVAIEVERR